MQARRPPLLSPCDPDHAQCTLPGVQAAICMPGMYGNMATPPPVLTAASHTFCWIALDPVYLSSLRQHVCLLAPVSVAAMSSRNLCSLHLPSEADDESALPPEKGGNMCTTTSDGCMLVESSVEGPKTLRPWLQVAHGSADSQAAAGLAHAGHALPVHGLL